MSERKQEERIFVKAFNKYIDELTAEEWQLMVNESCDGPLRNCESSTSDPNKKTKD